MVAYVRHSLRLALLFLVTLASCVALLVGTAAIVPRAAIRGNMLASAEFLCERPSIFEFVEGVKPSCLDRYADAVLLSIVYAWDETDPLDSTMWSRFYGDWTVLQNEHLLEAVRDGRRVNQEYLRYWHGSGALLRFLHVVMSLKGIYALCTLAMVGLLAWLVVVLVRSHMVADACCLLLALASVNVWFCPLCLEYVWVFLIALVASLVAVRLSQEGAAVRLDALFLVVGMVTAFMDFLTAETLTLTIPLLLVLRAAPRASARLPWVTGIRSCLCWVVGYGGMWASKWGLSAVVLGIDPMPYVTGHVTERVSGTSGLPSGESVAQALERNFEWLFPAGYGELGMGVMVFVLAAIALAVVSRHRVVRRDDVNRSRLAVLLLVGLIPIVRIIVLHAHAWQHAGFTSRALAATVMAVLLVFPELLALRPKGVPAGDEPASGSEGAHEVAGQGAPS